MTRIKKPVTPEAIGQRLKQARLDAGLTLTEVGAKVGVSHQMIHKYENGSSAITAIRVVELAGVLGLSATEILGVK